MVLKGWLVNRKLQIRVTVPQTDKNTVLYRSEWLTEV